MVWWKNKKAHETHEGNQVVENTPETESAEQVDTTAEIDKAENPVEAEQITEAEDADVTDVIDVDEAADVDVEEPVQSEVAQDTSDEVVVDTADETALMDVPEDLLTDTVEQTIPQANHSNPDFTVPFETMASPVSSSAGVPLVSATVKTGHKVRNTLLTVAGSVLGAALLVVGCGAVGSSYFDSHAKPGAELAGRDLTGFSMTQVRNVAATLIENYRASLQLDGKVVEATQKDLGITFDLDKTVGGVMNAGSTAVVSDRYNPFNTKHALLVMSVDEGKLQNYLNDTFISDEQRSVPALVVYDGDQGAFVVQPGKDGTKADAAKVAQQLKAGGGIGEALTIATTSESPLITADSAQQTADTANQLLATPYKVTAASVSYTIPASSIASWVQFTPDEDAGTIQMGINTEQASADIPPMLSENLSKPVVAQQSIATPDGRVMGVQQEGVNGTEVEDPAAVTAQIVQALVDRTGMDATVPAKATPFTEQQTQIAEGTKWVEINRSNFTVTRWEGSTALSTWSVVIGKPSTPTHTGIFHVYAKVTKQDMRGADYVQPNVKWIAYFDGDIALHGNYWVSSFGWAASHGCVGMPESQAEVMFNWIEYNTLVWVHD